MTNIKAKIKKFVFKISTKFLFINLYAFENLCNLIMLAFFACEIDLIIILIVFIATMYWHIQKKELSNMLSSFL